MCHRMLIIFSVFVLFPGIVMAVSPSSDLKLTEAELNWLELNQTVRFTGDPNWLPYEAFNKKGEYVGIVAEHIRLIAQMTTLEFKMIPSKTWTESTEKAKQGLVDILSETDDSDLKSHLNFTAPYITNPIVIAMHYQENYVESISHIKNRKIALIRDYGYAPKIRRKYPDIQFVTVDNIQDGLISVSTGKIDALLCTLVLCSYNIAELGLNNVKIIGKTEFDTKLALGVQKNLPELLSILNKAIDIISREQQQIILDSWIKDKFPVKTDYQLAFQVMGAALVLLVIFAIWIRRLTREVNLRKRTEEDLKAAEEVLRFSHQRLLLHRERTPFAVIEWNTKFEILDWNPAANRIFGYTREEVLGKPVFEKIVSASAKGGGDRFWSDLLKNKKATNRRDENVTKAGHTIVCEWHDTPLVDQNGNVIGVTSLVEDVTERKRNEENQQQTQKMDAIGKLTGGIAHDFNNMLGVILGFSVLLRSRLNGDDAKNIKYCGEILNAGERAKILTTKLLEFSRNAPTTAVTLYFNELLNDMQLMLEKTLTHRIQMVFDLQENIWPVSLDKSRLENAILNVCINAMHAMPDGGTLTLSTSNRHLCDADVLDEESAAGDYVLLSISDTGIGMTKDIQEKVFEPFFTTKGTEGTGLGLSQVYGFVQQAGGHVDIKSEPGRGAQIDIFIPRLQAAEVLKFEEAFSKSEKILSGNETILVVDDEVALLDLTKDVLMEYGYNVLCAENAESALKILKYESVDLMLSNVIMPGMDGYQLATEVGSRYPKIVIQMTTGFSEEHRMNLVNDKLHQQRLNKPVNSRKLLVRVRQLLDNDKVFV